jgi:hypothetical protein
MTFLDQTHLLATKTNQEFQGKPKIQYQLRGKSKKKNRDYYQSPVLGCLLMEGTSRVGANPIPL